MLIRRDGVLSAALSLTITTIGAGVLAVPLAFQEGGVAIGSGVLTLVAALTVLSIDYLILCVVYLGLKSYEDIARELLGRTFEQICRWILILYYIGIAAGYIVVVREIYTSLEPLLQQILGFHVNSGTATTLTWLFLMMPACCISDITVLHSISFLAIVTTFFISSIIVYRYLRPSSYFSPVPFSEATLWKFSDTCLLALPVMMFSFDCQTLVFQLFSNLRHASRKSMLRVSSLSVVLTSLIYGSVGLFGYLSFGSKVRGNILSNYDPLHDRLFALAEFLYLITVTIAYALLLIPCRDAVHIFVYGYNSITANTETDRKIRAHENTIVCCVLSAASYLVSLRASSIAFLIALLGGLCSSVMCFCFPASFRLMLHYRGVVRCNTVMLTVAYSVFVFGVIAGALGTYVSLISDF